MIARRAYALLLSFALSSPAAAQARALLGEAVTAPTGGAGTPAAFAPSLSETERFPSLSGTSILAAPSAPAANAPSNPAFAAPSFAPAAVVDRPAAPSSPSSPLSAAEAGARGRADSGASSLQPAPASPATAPLDELFDGRAALAELPAVSAAPQRLSEKRRALSPSPRLLSRTGRLLKVAVPIAAAGGIALGAAAPHAALAGLHALGQASYWVANPLAFLFTVPQIHRILSRRSAEVSMTMTAIGLISALVTTLCFAFDGKDLMMYRNLAQTAGFAAMLGLQARYARAKQAAAPSRTRALLETGAVVLAFGAITAAAGPALMAAMPAVALMSSLLVPFQILSGFGFTYMMYAQLRKMSLEHSAGDASPGMMWAYLGTKVIWVWSFATMLSLVAAPAWLTLAAGALFAGACWLATRFALSRLLRAPWAFLPEKIFFRGRVLTRRAMSDVAAFVALAALILALSGVGHIAFASLLGVKAGAGSLFAMYLLYTVQNLVAAMATSKTLRLQARFGQEAPASRP